MTAFAVRGGELHAEDVPLSEIAARFDTPTFVYSRREIEDGYRAYDEAFADVAHLVCYALKANSNLSIIDVLARAGSGFDIVSGGELARVIAAGGDPRKVVFSGVGKSEAEMKQGLDAGILCFNVESASELARLNRVASGSGRRAPVSLRVNPDVDPRTHPYISTGLKESKFGIAFDRALELYRHGAAMPGIEIRGVDMHIGSQITELEPFCEAAAKVFGLVDGLAEEGIELTHVDLGGGLGIRYRDEQPLDLAAYATAVKRALGHRRCKLLFEPGRYLVGNAGVLLTRVTCLKPGDTRNFAIVDAGMNDLLRPALYEAWHGVEPVRPRTGENVCWQIVGPICESADFLAHDRSLVLREDDLLAIRSAGAYAMAMASNYNSRPRACEVMVDGSAVHVVGRRESEAEMFVRESTLP